MKTGFPRAVSPELRHRLIDRLNRRGHFWEIVTVILLTGSIVLPIFEYASPLLVLSLFGLLATYFSLRLAVRLAARSDRETRRQARRVRYLLTEKSMETLKTVHTPRDAMGALYALWSSKPEAAEFKKDELIDGLTHQLGAARTDEVKEIIYKYLRRDEDFREPAATEKRAHKPSTASPNGKSIYVDIAQRVQIDNKRAIG